MQIITAITALLVFPGGLAVLAGGLAYQWIERKLLARLQNRVGPRWFQPLADLIKLLAKEEIVPEGANRALFTALPLVALAGVLTAALYVPLWGLPPVFSFAGDLIVAIYLLALLTLSLCLAGANTISRFTLIGTTRTMTQLFSYEAPFLLAMLGPAIVAGSWQVREVTDSGNGQWLLLSQPLGFVIAIISLMAKLELAPFDAPEAETEIVAGALTEYGGRGLALFKLAKDAALVVGLSLIGALYMGGFANPLDYAFKTLVLLFGITFLRALLVRRRIDQTVGLWWRVGAFMGLAQTLAILIQKAVAQ